MVKAHPPSRYLLIERDAQKTKKSFEPSAEQQALLPEVSGNTLNGVGEKSLRRPTPVYWYKPDTIPHGPAQAWMTEKFNAVPDLRKVYATPDARGPRKRGKLAQVL